MQSDPITLGIVGSLAFIFKSWIECILYWFFGLFLVSVTTCRSDVLDKLASMRNWSNLEKNYRGWGLAEGVHLLWKPLPILIKRASADWHEAPKVTLYTVRVLKTPFFKFVNVMMDGKELDYRTYTLSAGDQFRCYFRRTRDAASLCLKSGLWEELVQEISAFRSQMEKFAERGLVAKKSLLFYGPPGTGKTSLAHMLAGHFNYEIYICKSRKFKDLYAALAKLDVTQAVLLFDDLDELIKSEDFDLGQFLSLLDHMQISGLIIFTCNDPSRLPSKLTRVGRIDRKFKIDLADQDQIRRLFSYYHPDSDLAEKFAAQCDCIAPAVVQEFLLRHSAQEAVDNLESYLKALELERVDLAKEY